MAGGTLNTEPIYHIPAESIVKQKTEQYKAALLKLDSEAVKVQAQKLWDMGLNFVLLNPTNETYQDSGKVYRYQAIGKKSTIEGWPEIALDRIMAPTEIPVGWNIGIQTGTPVTRNGKTFYGVDIDVDSVSALQIFAKVFRSFDLPTAYMWGRPSKPRSHYFYLADKPTLTTTGKKIYHGIAEIRCQSKGGTYVPYGHQTVTFPSVWCGKNGEIETIRQEADSAPEPPIVSCDLLVQAVNTATAIAILAPLLPPPPRHDIRLAFFRLAATGGLPMADAVRFISLIENLAAAKTTEPDAKFESEAEEIYKIVEAGFKGSNGESINLWGLPHLVETIGASNEQSLQDSLELLQITVSRGTSNTRHSKDNKDTDHLPFGFAVNEEGVWYTKEKQPDDDDEPAPFRVSSKLDVIAIVQERDGDESGLEVRWRTVDNEERTWTFPRSMLHNDASSVREELFRRGFQFIEPSKRGKELFVRYLMSCTPRKRKHSVTRVGWHGDSYVTPVRIYAPTAPNEEIVYQSLTAAKYIYSQGSLDDWQKHIAARCAGNSRLVLAVSCAFAAPAMPLANAESGGINLIGTSSTGKTTTLNVAASVVSNEKYVQMWRATSNGLEGVAAQYNHSLLPLDELSQSDPEDCGEMVYMLANQKGKLRMSKAGVPRPTYEWQLLFLSTGEKDLASHIGSGRKKIKGGQLVRCLDIPADAGIGMGIFEQLHGAASPGHFAVELKQSTSLYHGTAFPTFIELLVKNPDTARQKINDGIQTFARAAQFSGDVSGEVFRAVQRFGLIAASGELATEYGITGWTPGESTAAANKCMNSWLALRGGVKAGDVTNGLLQVMHFLELHGESRFQDLDAAEPRTLNRVGFRERINGEYAYYVLPEAFRQDVCTGYDANTIARALAERKALVRGDSKHLTTKKVLPGLGRTNVYQITAHILFEDDQ